MQLVHITKISPTQCKPFECVWGRLESQSKSRPVTVGLGFVLRDVKAVGASELSSLVSISLSVSWGSWQANQAKLGTEASSVRQVKYYT